MSASPFRKWLPATMSKPKNSEGNFSSTNPNCMSASPFRKGLPATMSKPKNSEGNFSTIIPTSADNETKLWQYGKVALASLLITGVWSLASLPIIFYYLPTIETPSNTYGSSNVSEGNSVCSTPVQYNTTSGVCVKELANILTSSNCLPDPGGSVAVMRNGEVTATQLINGFTLFGASAECLSKVVPFLCLHVFGLCGGSGVSIQPTSSRCEEVRDKTCQQQWMIIKTLDIALPDCKMFPAEYSSCHALNNSLSINGTVNSNMSEEHSNVTTAEVLECTGDFYQEKGSSYCTRSCNTWVEFGRGRNLTSDVVTVVLLIFAFLINATMIIISCLSRKRMLTFPAIFLVYIIVDYIVLDIFTFVGLMDRDKFFCTSRSLSKSLREVTSFCIIFGIVFTYTIYQIILWWIFHITTLFWKVQFTFHALTFEESGKNKSIHLTCIAVGILLPLVPIASIITATAVNHQEKNENSTVQLGNSLFTSDGLGFGPLGFRPFFCIPLSPEANFYSFILVVDLILGCGCTMLIIVFWSIHKLYIKRKRMQKNSNFMANGKARPQFTFGTAEKKLLTVLCYYVVLIAVVLSVFTLDSRNIKLFNNTLQKFLICELGRHNSSNPCTFSDTDSFGYDIMQIVAAILLKLLPVVNLIYVVNIQELQKLWRKYVVHGPQ